MQKLIPYGLLRPGYVLPGALRDGNGREVLPAGTLLDETRIAQLGRRIIVGMYGGDDWPAEIFDEPETEPDRAKQPTSPSGKARLAPETPDDSNEAQGKTVTIDSLRVETRLSQNIYDQDGVLLLAAGKRVSSRFLHLLRQRNIRSVFLEGNDQSESTEISETERCQQLDELISAELKGSDPLGPRGRVSRTHLPLKALREEVERGLERHVATSDMLAGACEALKGGKTISGEEMADLVKEFSDMLTLDCDLLSMIVGMQKTSGEYLFDHCLNVSLMSMTIAARLGLNREKILEIGLCTVFQDVGMLRIPKTIRLAPRELTGEEWQEIKRHPIYTLEYLSQIQQLPTAAQFIGYQMHERIDRSGYPRQRSGSFMHPFAKISAIADTYVAMTRPRPYRTLIPPHQAVKQILVDGSLDKFDRTILRAFLDSVSTFPIGISVELSTGAIGQVIRANPGAHTRPVVAQVDADGVPTDKVIDLLNRPRVKVVRTL